MVVACLLGMVACAVIAGLAGCSPSRQPPPSVSSTVRELERIEAGIVEHEIAVARWRGQR